MTPAELEHTERMIEEAWHRGRHMRDTEVDELRAEIQTLKSSLVCEPERYPGELGVLRAEIERLRAALRGVLAEADRKTDAFDRAHAALERHSDA